MQVTSTNKISVRFGWYSHGHHAIDTGAIKALPTSSYQTWLQRHLPAIKIHDSMRDEIYAGPSHFCELDGLSESKKSHNRTGWNDVLQQFTPENKQTMLDKLPTASPPEVNAINSIYQSAFVIYTQLAKLKRGLTNFDGQPVQNKQQIRVFRDHLIQNIGSLAHYVGDLLMPLHTTRFYNWPILGISQKKMHGFIESEVFSERQSAYPQLKPLPEVAYIPLNELKQTLQKTAQQSYLKVFDIVAVQKQALDEVNQPQYIAQVHQDARKLLKRPLRKLIYDSRRTGQLVQQSAEAIIADRYERLLAQRLKPILESQVMQAQQLLATILQSLWVEAQKPELK
jgi:hypothetical protein